MQPYPRNMMNRVRRAVLGAMLTAGVLAALAAASRAYSAEIIPSIGLQRSVNGGDDAKPYYGLAVRGQLAPFLKAEIGGAYREDKVSGGDFTVKSWPITTSLWLTPMPVVYAGGGVGWYNTTTHFAPALNRSDETDQDFGAHVGGGLQIPLAPSAALDLNGRYIFLPKKGNDPMPQVRNWDPSFWTTTLGLAIHF